MDHSTDDRVNEGTRIESETVTRRYLAKVLGGTLGAYALSACSPNGQGDSSAQAQLTQAYTGVAGSTIGWADTVADLRALVGGTGTNSMGVVILKGYATPGDGGGGVFIWNPNTTNVEDGGVVFVQTTGTVQVGQTTGQAWVRIHEGSISVKWFGAKGNSVTDDSAAFVNALAAISLNGSDVRIVEVPAGTYVLTQTLIIPSNVWIRGVNFDQSVLRFNMSASSSRPWGDGILCENGSQRISDLYIRNVSSGNTTGRGVDLTSAIGGPAIVERCFFDGWQQQLVFDGYEVSVCRDCYFALGSGVPASTNNVHIRFAAPHGRNNATSQNTNVIKVENCGFFSNGGVFLWHEDGITHTCEFLNFEAGNDVSCVKCTRAIGVHYDHCQSEGPCTVVMIDKPSSVAVQNLKITQCQFAIPSNAPILHVTAGTIAWGVYVHDNEFFGLGGSATGVYKLDGYVDKGHQFGPNLIPDATTIFVGSPYGYGVIWQSGRLGLGAAFAAGKSAITIQEDVVVTGGKSVLSMNAASGDHWWIGVGGRAMQWKRATTGFSWDMPNGETSYQEYLIVNVGAAAASPFASATDYPLMSGLHASDDLMHVYEMEAIGHGVEGTVFYHRKQRLSIVQYAAPPIAISGLSSYPDEFEKTAGPGWPSLAANMTISGGQISLTIQSNSIDSVRWYVKVRIISRANY